MQIHKHDQYGQDVNRKWSIYCRCQINWAMTVWSSSLVFKFYKRIVFQLTCLSVFNQQLFLH